MAMTGKNIGMGHVKRSQILHSHASSQAQCVAELIYYCPDKELEFQADEFVLFDWELLCQSLTKNESDIIVFDMPVQYVNNSFLLLLQHLGKKTVVIDDSDELHNDQGIDLKICCSIKFNKKTDGKNKLFGPNYIILNQDFQGYSQEKRFVPSEIKNVLLSFGGTDPNRITEKVISILRQIEIEKTSLHIDVILGRYADALPEYLLNHDYHCIRIYRDVANMPERLWNTDVAIISGGMTLYEAVALGTPVITVNQNLEQEEEAQCFDELGAILNAGFYDQIDNDKLTSMFTNISKKSVRELIIGISREIIDSKGVRRIMDKLLSM